MTGALAPRNRQVVTAALLLGTFLSAVEVTIVGAAMPSIVEELGGLQLFPWVFTAYMLTGTVTIPIYGRLADVHGRRRTYLVGVSIFLVGALACGAAPSMEWLVAARCLQGLGAGCLLPLTQTIFGDLYPVDQRTRLQGLFSLVWGASSVIGPSLGGAIVEAGAWPWIFWLNLPIGLFAACVIALRLPEYVPGTARALDRGGLTTLVLTIVSLLLALLPPDQRPGTWWAWAGVAVLSGALFLRIERGHPAPVVPLHLFAERTLVAANLAGLLMGVTLLGVVGFLPLYLQGVHGASPIWAGCALIPLSLTWTSASLLAGRLVTRHGFQRLVRLGGVAVALGGLGQAAGAWFDSVPVLIAGLVAYGGGMGFCISSFTVSVQEAAPADQRGIATALAQFARSIGGTVGVAVLGAVLAAGLGTVSLEGAELGDPTLIEPLRAALVWVFAVMGVTGVLAGVVAVVLFPSDTPSREQRRPA